jgi:hypothetical protein
VLASNLLADHQRENLAWGKSSPALLTGSVMGKEVPSVPIILLARAEASRILHVARRIAAVIEA